MIVQPARNYFTHIKILPVRDTVIGEPIHFVERKHKTCNI